MVEIYKTVDSKIKGKLCHFQKEDFVRHGLGEFFWKPVVSIDFELLKEKVKEILQKEGFVFYDTQEYKYVSHFGKLHEFAIQFWHIA